MVAREAQVSHETVRNWLKELNIFRPKKKSLDEFTKEMLGIVERFEGKLSIKARAEWIKVIQALNTDIEEKQNPKKPEPGRVTHRTNDPRHKIEHGGGQAVSNKHYDPITEGYSIQEEMSLISEMYE